MIDRMEVSTVAKRLNVSAKTVYALIKNRELTAICVGVDKGYRVERDSLLAFERARTTTRNVTNNFDEIVRKNEELRDSAVGMRDDLQATFRLLVQVLELAEPVNGSYDDAVEFVVPADNIADLRDLQQRLYYKYFKD